jgi:hypothetical protein
MTPKQTRILLAIVSGLILTCVFTVIAFSGDSRSWGCTFAWQACLVQIVVHTPANSVHEGTPIDLFAFAFGILLGVPIYSLFTYFVLLRRPKPPAASD